MPRLRTLLAGALPILLLTSSPASAADGVIVQWAPASNHRDRVEARTDAGVEFATDLGNRSFQLVEVEPGQTAGAAVRELEADPAVTVAEPDGYDLPHAIPNDPLFGQLWGLRNVGLGIRGVTGSVSGDDANLVAAWDRTVGTPSTTIADIDSGYRFEHPDLGPVAWTNPGEVANGIDDDGNGIADDLHGADLIGANGESPLPDGNPTDEDLISGGHGVHTAGTLGAAGNNGVGISGVAQNVRIMPLRACARYPTQAKNLCDAAAQVAAINYAGQKGARVANMSLGSTTFRQTVVNAIAANPKVLFVISAGNDSENNDSGESGGTKGHHYPCDYRPTIDASPPVPGAIDNIVCVAATNQADKLASFSDYGAVSVDLGAPGTETLSTYPFNRIVDDNFQVDDFASKWSSTGANGGFSRSNEAPLTSFGMTDSPGVDPPANTVSESTSVGVAIPPGLAPCNLTQSRTLSLGTTGTFTYEVLRNGAFVSKSSPTNSSESATLALGGSLVGGGNIQVRFRFEAGSTPVAGNGVWLDNIELECAEPVGMATSYAFLQGTSMAAPHVSGAAGLLFSLKPSAGVAEVRNALLTSTRPLASLSGKTVTGGRLDAAAALERLVPTPKAPVVPPPLPPPTCKVPKLAGKKLAQAKSLLKSANCKLGKVKKPKAKKGHKLPPLVVKFSTPGAGAAPAGGTVDLKLGPKPKKKHKKRRR